MHEAPPGVTRLIPFHPHGPEGTGIPSTSQTPRQARGVAPHSQEGTPVCGGKLVPAPYTLLCLSVPRDLQGRAWPSA